MRAATSSAGEDERGFTLVELMITMLVMGIVATAVMAVALRTFTDTATITGRRDAFNDARFAIDRLTGELRQGESVDSVASTPSSITFTGYVNGTETDFVWRVTGSAAPYSLEESRDGGTPTTRLSSLASANVFTYTLYGGVVDQVTVSLSLETPTATVDVSTNVHLRNSLT